MLEAHAAGRASRELEALLERTPRTAHRYERGELAAIPVGQVLPRDRLLVMRGEVIPVDGVLEADHAVLDESALTGEARPVERTRGDPVRSGGVNTGPAFDLRATASADDSTYVGIERLVEQAQSRKAPFVRMADRYALAFGPLTMLIAGAACAVSGDPCAPWRCWWWPPPCPLILAAPVAIVSGMARAAHRGVIVKDGDALDALAHARVLLLGQTGTLSAGAPRLRDVETFGRLEPNELLRLTATLDQASPHPLTSAIVAAARQRCLALPIPTGVEERPGAGIRGVVDGHALALGNAERVAGRELPPAAPRVAAPRRAGQRLLCLRRGRRAPGRGAGPGGPLRPDAARVVRELLRAGIERVVMVSGDHAEVAESISVDRVLTERDPADKVDAVPEARREG